MKKIEQRLKTFAYVFKRSLTEPKYYSHILQSRFWFSFKYLYFLFYIISLCISLTLVFKLVTLLPQIPIFQQTATQAVKDFYPDELIITIKDGQLKTNVDEPYYIELPRAFVEDEKIKTHFITIDTTAAAEDYARLNTIVLVTKTAIVYPDKNGNRIYFLSNIKENFVIDKEKYARLTAKLLPMLDYLPALMYIIIFSCLLVLPLVVAGGLLLTELIYLLLIGLLLWLIATFMKNGLRYTQVLQLSLHAATGPIIVSSLSWLGIALPYVPTIYLVLWMIYIFTQTPAQTLREPATSSH